MEDLEAMVEVTVTAELANGKVYVLKEAGCKSALENNTREGQFRVRFEGTTCEEINT
jgi:Phage tail tube protein